MEAFAQPVQLASTRQGREMPLAPIVLLDRIQAGVLQLQLLFVFRVHLGNTLQTIYHVKTVPGIPPHWKPVLQSLIASATQGTVASVQTPACRVITENTNQMWEVLNVQIVAPGSTQKALEQPQKAVVLSVMLESTRMLLDCHLLFCARTVPLIRHRHTGARRGLRVSATLDSLVPMVILARRVVWEHTK